MGMVQTYEQYEFIYKYIKSEIESMAAQLTVPPQKQS